MSLINLEEKINELRKQKKAVILAHYYVRSEIQDIADYVGDSLGLSQKAANTDADIIVFAGVNFMAETAKILSPVKKFYYLIWKLAVHWPNLHRQINLLNLSSSILIIWLLHM